MMRYDDPLALFRAATAALQARDLATVVSLCDPVSVRAFKRELLQLFSPRDPQHVPTVEHYRSSFPDLSRDGAESMVARWNAAHDLTQQIRDTFVGVDDRAMLEAMSAEQVFAAWVEGHSPYRRLDAMLQETTMPLAKQDLLRANASMFWQFRTLGVIHDGEHIAYVVYRFGMDGSEPPSTVDGAWAATLPADERALAEDFAAAGFARPDLQRCRRQPDGGWLLIADDEFFQLGRGLWYGFEDIGDDDEDATPEVGFED